MWDGCPKCKTDRFVSSVEVTYDYDVAANKISKRFYSEQKKGFWKYEKLLPVRDEKHMLSLGEGDTPLIKCSRLGNAIGIKNLYIKDESRNPTWSFKDRLCCVAVSKGLEFDAKVTTISSSGNHGAATAAYSSRGGIRSVVFTGIRGQTPWITWIQAYGSMVVPVTSGEGRHILMRKCVNDYGWHPTGTFLSANNPMPVGNPYAMEGCKTMSYEICEQLKWESPSKVLMPLGLGEGFFGVWKGFKELDMLDFVKGTPSMIAVEPAVAAPLKNALEKNLDYIEKITTKPTVAKSIGGGLTASHALHAVRQSDGTCVIVTEEEIMSAQIEMASLEGLYAEATSATVIAALKKMKEQGEVDKDELIVCIMTSGGLKDPDVTKNVLPPLSPIDPNWDVFTSFMKKNYGLTLRARDIVFT
jgi:threonine synthase